MRKPNIPGDVETNGRLSVRHHHQLGFLYTVPIGALGGLIMGGAEFRLPVLAGVLGYSARQAVPLNLAVSLITIAASLAIRGRTLSITSVLPLLPVVLSLITRAIATAFLGAT